MSKSYKVLVVDDSKSVVAAVKSFLASLPYEIDTTTDPFHAYTLIENAHYDIVVCDIVMPQMDGITLLKKIKNFNGLIQVVMITGHTTINNTLTAFRAGALDVLFKPFEGPEELTKAVQAAAARLDHINGIVQRLIKQRNSVDAT